MLKFLKKLNDNHWYIIGALLIAGLLFWIEGCESQVYSIIDRDQKISRAELIIEVDYLLAQATVKLEDLDKQDEIKRILLEQAAIFATSGTFNPMGLLNTAVTIGAVAFGLDRNRKYKIASKANSTG